MNQKYLHYIAMWIIVLGALILFYLSVSWYIKENMIMALGMFIMGIITLANFYLHLKGMGERFWFPS